MESENTTLVLGASENPTRYSNRAMLALKRKGIEVIAVGKDPGEAHGIPITTQWPENGTVHSLSMYVSRTNQQKISDKIVNLRPKRIIFNPGSENPVLEAEVKKYGVECIHACTLVMLASDTF